MAFYQIHTEQKLPATIGEVWDFISSPGNLKVITPEYMGFEITSGNPTEKIYPGMIITYKVSPLLGIKMDWITEITQVRDKEYFIDEQRSGPYAMWHHFHKIEPVEGGVLMRDVVSYKPPFGPVGNLANKLFIGKQLNKIFEYRRQALEKLFPEGYAQEINI